MVSGVPTWDLTLVLQALTLASFEPMNLIPFYKTAFLLALASGKGWSEIHAIRMSKIFHSKNWSKVTFSIDHFVCKNKTYDISGSMFDSFTIH